MAKTPAVATLYTLHNANGSATYTSPNGTHRIVSGVNYPLEVPYRSSELPESTFIDVTVRPHNGVGMVRERHVEELVKKTLAWVVLGEQTPRTMLQVVLQVMAMQEDESLPGGVKQGGQGESYLDLMVGAVNAAVLGCLDAGVAMREVVGAALVGVRRDGRVVAWPTVTDRKVCTSLHGFGFSRTRDVVLMESEGVFEMGDWQRAMQVAQRLVLGRTEGENRDVEMEMEMEMNGGDTAAKGDEGGVCLMDLMRQAVEAKVTRDERWKEV